MRNTLVSAAILLAMHTHPAHALQIQAFPAGTYSTDSANFTLLQASGASVTGGLAGGANDVAMTWDGTMFTDSADYTGPGSVSNVTASSPTTFRGHLWTAHDIQVFAPGTYSFDVTLGGGVAETGIIDATVAPNQMGMHMLFDWNGGLNIDVFVVAEQNGIFGSGMLAIQNFVACGLSGFGGTLTNCLWDGGPFGSDGAPVADQVWGLVTVDGNGDGVPGIPMAAGGPFAGFNAGFNANLNFTPAAVPVPAAAWLFGSGLVGLVGVARQRKRR